MTKSAYTPGDLLRDLLAAKKQTVNAAAMEIEARGYGASGSAHPAMSRMMHKGIMPRRATMIPLAQYFGGFFVVHAKLKQSETINYAQPHD